MICTGAILLALRGEPGAALEALTRGADSALELILTLAGSYLLWMGLINIAEHAGLTNKLARLMRRPLRMVMPNIGEAAAPVALNLSANFLGLANAATPFGIEAMKRLSEQDGRKSIASREICMFLALNASAVELLPTSVIAVRSACGSADPYSVVLPTFVSSVFAAASAVLTCKFFEALKR
ncbi:MAG: spore maturation protein [Clostridia bacterium]|nr:spore maturation protein [Clostridia bacterium]